MDSGAREGMESALHTNLLLLGIDKCPPPSFTAGMFRTTNPKGTEFVLHFLLTTLKPDNSALAGVWPIHDARQSSDFRRVALEMLKELENDGSLPRRNLLRATTLATACGERLVELLWRVSTLALRHAYTTVYPDTADLSGLEPPTPPPAPGSPAEAARLRVTQARVAVERRAFVERAAAGLKAAQEAEATAADLTSEYRELCKVKAEVGRERATLRAAGADEMTEADDARVARLRELWDSLLKECEELDARAPTVTALLDTPEDVERGLHAVTLRQAATEPSPLAAACQPPSASASFAASSVSSSAVADPADLPRLIQQWTRGMHRCGKALAPLLAAYDAAAAAAADGTADDDGGERGDASEWTAHAEALAEQVEEHTTYVEVLTALAATLQRHKEHRAAHSSAPTTATV